MNYLNLTSVLTGLLLTTALADKVTSKRGFADLGCMGVYDKSKFARLDRLCEECYQLFREPDIHISCRSNCFKNDFFNNCVDTLLLRKDQLSLDYMVDQLYGKK